jgi:hypothetical protein
MKNGSHLAIDPVNKATLYAGTMSAGLFKSTDGRRSWTAMGMTTTEVRALATDSANSLQDDSGLERFRDLSIER